MRSPHDRRDSGHARGPNSSVQGTLDAFEPPVMDDPKDQNNDLSADPTTDPSADPTRDPTTDPSADAGRGTGDPGQHVVADHDLSQESIDKFLRVGGRGPVPAPPPVKSRAMEGLAMEMGMERVALSEAASGILRDELLITIARDVKVPLEDLDLVDAYLTDLELEGRIRRVGELVVLPHPDDDDLLAMDLGEREFLARYRHRHMAPEGGGG